MTEEHPRQNEGKQEPLADPVQGLPIETPPVTLEFVHRHYRMHTRSEEELDMLASAGQEELDALTSQSNPINLNLFTSCLSIAVTIGIGLNERFCCSVGHTRTLWRFWSR
jgi:hypothetical protein